MRFADRAFDFIATVKNSHYPQHHMAEQLEVFSRNVFEEEGNEKLHVWNFERQSYLRYRQTAIFKGMIQRSVFFCVIYCGCLLVQAQLSEDIPTNSTVRKRVDHRKYEPKGKTYSFLYKKSTKGILYGNPCALEMTRQMGFEYVPLTQGRGKTRVGLILNNFAVKSKLCLTRTPFWKSILNKRLKDCRIKTGDFVG